MASKQCCMCRKARRVNDASHPCANAACSNRMHSDCAAAHYDAVKKRLLNHTDNTNWEDELRFCPSCSGIAPAPVQKPEWWPEPSGIATPLPNLNGASCYIIAPTLALTFATPDLLRLLSGNALYDALLTDLRSLTEQLSRGEQVKKFGDLIKAVEDMGFVKHPLGGIVEYTDHPAERPEAYGCAIEFWVGLVQYAQKNGGNLGSCVVNKVFVCPKCLKQLQVLPDPLVAASPSEGPIQHYFEVGIESDEYGDPPVCHERALVGVLVEALVGVVGVLGELFCVRQEGPQILGLSQAERSIR